MMLLFGDSAPDEGYAAPAPAAVLGRPVFEALLGVLHLGPPRAEAQRVSVTAVAPPRPAEVEYVDGVERVRRRLGVRETFGRAKDNSVILSDTMTSKHHALIAWDGARFVLHDRGSINGTRVDGHLVRGAVALTHNAKIELGRVSMRFRELVQAQSSQLAELARCFEQEGLAVPPIPAVLGMRLKALGPWFYSSEALPAPPLHGDLGASVAGDYVVVCHSVTSHGVATIQYCLGLGPLEVSLEWPWTLGASGAQAASRQLVAASVLGLRALLGAVNQCVRHGRWPHGVVLEVRAIHGVRSSWSPVGGGLARRTTGALGLPAPDVLADALAWVHAL
jgi:FHA domain